MQKLDNKKTLIAYVIVGFLITLAFSPVVTATKIVVNKSVSTAELSQADIRAIFTMQKRLWPNQKQIKVYTLSDSNPLHKDFVKNILNMFPHQVRRIWDRTTFSGTGVAPIELGSEEEMVEKIANTPDSIGYLNSNPDNENIRVYDDR